MSQPAGATSYPIHATLHVRFRDVDALGHVNNAVYLTYFEEARVAYYRALHGDLQATSFDFVVAEVACTYRSPAFMGETLDVAIGITEVRSRSFVFAYRITGQQDGRLVATGRSVQVMYDHAVRQSKTIPDTLRGKMEKVEGRAL